YALGLNDILAKEALRRKFGPAVLCSWIPSEPALSEELNQLLDKPTPEALRSFFRGFDPGGDHHGALETRRIQSATFVANGGRVVVRRWLDEPLKDTVSSLSRWFADLDIEPVVRGKKNEPITRRGRRLWEPQELQDAAPVPPQALDPSTLGSHPLSIYALAATTARVPSDIQSTVYDSLYRAALEGSNPLALLGPILHRIAVSASHSGRGIRFHTSRFALLKLILKRSEHGPMPIQRSLIETHDRPYNCGRLLALLDDIQYAAQGNVGSDLVAKHYGNASTYPSHVFQRLLRMEKIYRGKLGKDPKKRPIAIALGRKIDDVCALFEAGSPDHPPEFPGSLSPYEQGRFALGFHQQKAKDERDLMEDLNRKMAGGIEADEIEP
ncbi:type I-C CRISPR-associated protein Cas8c/Csd1, partial [Singulisphaera rosea]